MIVLPLTSYGDVSWFENVWVLDREITLKLWTNEFTEEHTRIFVPLMNESWNKHGDMELRVRDGVILFVSPLPAEMCTYSIRSVDVDSFELVLLEEVDQPRILVQRVTSGFCWTMSYEDRTLSSDVAPLKSECFKLKEHSDSP